MKNTNMTIQQIVCELSFPNASSFGTFFKKHTGLSPKNYRMGAE
ncbi:helix-turn-helix domain-containing protein [Segatella copri]|nr:AraC family transcriptional regulator [Segatella copri]